MTLQPVHRQPQLLSNDGPRPSFSRALWRIASADVSSGNVVTLLRDGAGTFDTLLALIESARETVDFECYIFRRDDVGERFMKAFVAAAERGVRVRVLLDWFGLLPTRPSYFRRLQRDGLEVRFFNPPGFRRWLGILPRDHRKVLVVDGRSGITGGFGIGREWSYGVFRRRRSPWRDTAVRIDGDAVKDLQQAFERMWARAGGRARDVPVQRGPFRRVHTINGVLHGDDASLNVTMPGRSGDDSTQCYELTLLSQSPS